MFNYLIFRYDDQYNLTLEYNNGIDKKIISLQKFSKSIGNYFDENGVLCYDKFTNDLRQLYDQTRLNTRKTK